MEIPPKELEQYLLGDSEPLQMLFLYGLRSQTLDLGNYKNTASMGLGAAFAWEVTSYQ